MKMTFTYPWKTRLGRALMLAGSLLLVAVIIIALSGSGASDLPTYSAKRGEFVVSITESGELKATNSEVLTAPPIRGSLQIVYLAPKGEQVEKGDTLVAFDGAEKQKEYDEAQSKLEISRANLAK